MHCFGRSCKHKKECVAFRELEQVGLFYLSDTVDGELHLLSHALLLLLQKPLSLTNLLNQLARLPNSDAESLKAVEFCGSLLRCMQAYHSIHITACWGPSTCGMLPRVIPAVHDTQHGPRNNAAFAMATCICSVLLSGHAGTSFTHCLHASTLVACTSCGVAQALQAAQFARLAYAVQKGAQVMLLRNLELTGNDRMLVNGSRGVIVDFKTKEVHHAFCAVLRCCCAALC